MRLFIVCCLLFCGGKECFSQQFYRFKSDFSIKEKETAKEQGRLVTGTVYFDQNLGKTAYHIRFPEPETWLVRDTFLFQVRADTLVSERTVPPVGEYSIFNMILSQQLNDFGLAKMGYTLGEVQTEGNQVISQWLPPEPLKKQLGTVTLAQQNKKLDAAAIYSADGKVMAKLYFQEYSAQNGLPVPTKIYQIYNLPEGEFVRIMTLKNIVVNQADEDNYYDFTVPDSR